MANDKDKVENESTVKPTVVKVENPYADKDKSELSELDTDKVAGGVTDLNAYKC